MSFWRPSPSGIEVTVRATPKGGRDGLDGVVELSDGRKALKVRVRAAPQDGEATAAVARVVAQAAGVAVSKVTLASGATARLKVFRIAGAPDDLSAALEASLKAGR